MNTNEKTTTLFGGKTVTVSFEPTAGDAAGGEISSDFTPRTEQVRVRQIPLRDYERGFGVVTDEIALSGFLCGRDRNWALTLAPQSHELVISTGREVNAEGFFAFAARRADQIEKQNQGAMVAFAGLLKEQPELLAEAIRAGSASPKPSLQSPPRPAA